MKAHNRQELSFQSHPFATNFPPLIRIPFQSLNPARTTNSPLQKGTSIIQPIEEFPNLGPKSTQWLKASGIETVEQLRRIGPVVAFKIVKQNHARASLNLLWALAAGLEGKDWRDLTPSQKRNLQRQLEEL